MARIAGGAFDGDMAGWARGLRRLHSPGYLRPMHEMNGDWYPWGGTVNNTSPELFRVAWRRMVTISRQQGAKNVRCVWCPDTLKRLGPQPIWIPEVGASATGGNKAAWIRGMFRDAA